MTVDKHADPIYFSVTRLSRCAGRLTNLVFLVCNRVFDGFARARLSCGNVVRPYRMRIGGWWALAAAPAAAQQSRMSLPPGPHHYYVAAAGPSEEVPTS